MLIRFGEVYMGPREKGGTGGLRYTADFGRDLAIMARLVKAHNEAIVADMIDSFFDAQAWRAARQRAGDTNSPDPRWAAGGCGLDVLGLAAAVRHLVKAYKLEGGGR